MPLHPERKAAWVAALRSGEYKQAKGALRKRDAFCCLGVLCDLYSKSPEGTAAGAVWVDGRFYEDPDDTLGQEEVLPPRVREWIGTTNDAAGETEREDEYGERSTNVLTEWNDTGVPFAEIADMIEAQL